MQKILRYANIFYAHAAVKLAESGSGPKGAALPDSFWIKYVQMCQRLQVDPYGLAAVMNNESGFDPGARNIQGGVTIAQGLNQLIKSTAGGLGIKDDLWKNFYKLSAEEHLKWSEKFFQKFGARLKGKTAGDIYLMNFGGYPNPDGSIYAGKEAQERWKATHPDAVFKNPEYQQKCIEQNKGFVENGRIMPERVKATVAGGPPKPIKDRIDAAIQIVGNKPPPPFEEPNPNWTGHTDSDSGTSGTQGTPEAPKPNPLVAQAPTPQAPIPQPGAPASGPEDIGALNSMLWS